MPRILHHFKIGHTKQEVGPLCPDMYQKTEKQWEWILEEVKKIAKAPGAVHKVYNDSLDDGESGFGCRYQIQKLREALKNKKWPDVWNYRVWVCLARIGAELRPTESEDLTIKYRDFASKHPKNEIEDNPALTKEFQQIIDERDRFISDRINQDLQDGEVGILLLGFKHGRTLKFESDITVKVYNKYFK